MAFDEGPIPWSVIDRYAEVNDIVGEQRDDLFFHVRRLDRAYLSRKRGQEAKPQSGLKTTGC